MADPQRRRTALVTGASRGIGAAIAVSLATDGYAVGINYARNTEAAHETAARVTEVGGEAVLLQADMAEGEQIAPMVEKALAQLDHLDVVVLNAGICPFTSFFDLTEEIWDHTHAVNVKGAFLTAQAASRAMVERGQGGRIVFISSISAVVGGARQAHYCATKAAMLGLMKSMAIALGPHGITSNAIMPGPITTDANRLDLTEPGKLRYFEDRIPVGRIGDPADVGDAVKLLVGDDARYINGAELVVDGGLLVNLQ